MGLMDKIRTAMRSWLSIEPGIDNGAIVIASPLSFDAHVLRNRIWYRGEASEIESFFKQTVSDSVSSSRFWAAVPSIPIRKIHVDIAGQMIDRMAGIVAGDFSGFEFQDKATEVLWDEIAQDNTWTQLANDAIAEALCTGDGAFKVSVELTLSQYPIIEFYGADRITPIYERGRLKEIVFHTLYVHRTRRYRLDEHYGKGYIDTELMELTGKDDKPVPLTEIHDTAGLKPRITFKGEILAAYLRFFVSPQFPNRGASILASKSDAFDAMDEVVSEWWDDYRKGRIKQFLPETMFPRDPETGKVRRPSGFDDLYVLTRETMNETGGLAMQTFAPDIRADRYLAGYAQALDMALMGVISPSTMGIDLKKMDNATAQREKEKATLWTRQKIVDTLTAVWPELVQAVITAADNMAGKAPREVDCTVTFGEYASPGFDVQLQSMGVAAQWNLLSIEQTVEELWGDTKDDEWKEEEVDRIKQLRGVATVDEPSPGSPPLASKPMIGAMLDGSASGAVDLSNGTDDVSGVGTNGKGQVPSTGS